MVKLEKEYQISWLKIVGITALIAVVVVIICLVYPRKDDKTLLTQQTYINNMTLMKEAGFEYFQGSNLPEEIGDSKRITLDEMLARNLIVDFYDEEGNTCNVANSYIEATKTLDNEYEMSVFLSCNNQSDYIITTISNEVICTNCEIDNADNAVDNSSSNNNSTNSSGSSNNNADSGSSSIKPTYNSNSSSSKPVSVTQTTNVNINYINNCCVSALDCRDDCLANVYHSVVFDSNGGSSVRTQIVKHGSVASYASTYRDGYEFLGWYLNGEKYDFKTPVTRKITLVAKWQKESKNYIVDYESNGGSYVESEEVREGDKATRPKDPTRECYDFVGWYTDAALTHKYDFGDPVTNDMTLYAKWKENDTCTNVYQVKFDSKGGSKVDDQAVKEGNKAYEPKDPTRDGYKFLGWYLDGELFDFDTKIYKDITLIAKWEKEEILYNEYCKVKTDTYYSISYVAGDQSEWNSSWLVKFYNLENVSNLQVTNVGHLTSIGMYNKAYSESSDKGIFMIGDDLGSNVAINSGYMLQNYSLKASNFIPSVGSPYYSNGDWYAKLSIRVKNYNNVNAYYASNIGSKIYFVPFYFDVKYTDLNDCVTDKASNSSKYKNYEIVDSFWK